MCGWHAVRSRQDYYCMTTFKHHGWSAKIGCGYNYRTARDWFASHADDLNLLMAQRSEVRCMGKR